MRQVKGSLMVETTGQGLYEITARVQAWVAAENIREGLLTLYLHHTSASLLIQENADADVLHDLNDFFRRVVPEDMRHYRHTQEGPDDMPAHIRAALTTTQLAIPVEDGRPDLGRWQGIFVFEHRGSPKRAPPHPAPDGRLSAAALSVARKPPAARECRAARRCRAIRASWGCARQILPKPADRARDRAPGSRGARSG